MYLCLLLAMVVGVPAGTGETTPPSARANSRLLEGTWELLTLEGNPGHLAELSMKDLAEARLVVQGHTWRWNLGKAALKMTSRPQVGKGPQMLDLTIAAGLGRGQTFRALYVLEGNTLKICSHRRPGKERPREIVTRPDGEYVIVVWKRQASGIPNRKHHAPQDDQVAGGGKPLAGTMSSRK